MKIGYPLLLVAGLLIAAGLIVVAVLFARRRSAALVTAGVAVTGLGRGAARLLGLWLCLAAVVVLAVGAAAPSASLPVARSAGTAIIALDVSNSMAATDLAPSRLAAAQQAALAFVDAQPSTVDLGVVGFDQGALTTSLPGADRAATKAAVQNLRIAGGTSLAQAVLGSIAAITGKPVTIGKDGALPDIGFWGSATIVLFSDGEDSASGNSGASGGSGGGTGPNDPLTAATTVAQNAGIHIETVGVGTPQGTTVTVDGYQLHTALDADTLTQIAQATGGSYHPATDVGQLNDVASGIDLRLTVAKQDVPLAGAFIAVALALLAAGALLTGVRTGRVV